jgi:hypothetical protein
MKLRLTSLPLHEHRPDDAASAWVPSALLKPQVGFATCWNSGNPATGSGVAAGLIEGPAVRTAASQVRMAQDAVCGTDGDEVGLRTQNLSPGLVGLGFGGAARAAQSQQDQREPRTHGGMEAR